MSQAVWTGGISFGLVNIPVRLYPATEPKDVRFHLYDRRTGKRIRYERVTKDTDAPTFEPEAWSEPPEGEDRIETPIEGDYETRLPEPRATARPGERVHVVRGYEMPTSEC